MQKKFVSRKLQAIASSMENYLTTETNINDDIYIDHLPNHNVMNHNDLFNVLKDDIYRHNDKHQLKQDRINTLLSTKQDNPTQNNNNKNNSLNAIIHIGPQKTGSSSIQQFMIKNKVLTSLRDYDNYAKVPDINVVTDKSFASCFYNDHSYDYLDKFDTLDYQCRIETIEQTIQLAIQNNNNLIFTSETISGIKFNVSKFHHFINMYYSNISIVVYYRRFFSWIVSLHNQQSKFSQNTYKRIDIGTRTSLVDYLNNYDLIKKVIYDGYYFIGTIRRFQQYFNHNQIRYYHINHLNQPSLLEHFYCTAIPDASHTCRVTRGIIDKHGIPHTNDGIDLIYQDLTYYANEMNLISSDIRDKWPENNIWINKVSKAARYHQYRTLNILNSYNFGNINAIPCPNTNTLDILWNLTISAEKEFFPQYYNDSSSFTDTNNELVSEFNYYIDNYKFCHIDATMILYNNNNQWTEFFQKLTVQSVQYPHIYPIQ